MADRPLRDWQRMSKYVQLRIQTHPLLEPLRAAGKPPILHAHDRPKGQSLRRLLGFRLT